MAGLSSTIQEYINNAAAQFGVSTSYLNTTALIESGGNPLDKSSLSSASGLFQFTQSTGAMYGLSDPFDPQQSANAAAALAVDNSNYLSRALGQAPSDAQLYLAHQQGASGALSLLTHGSENAASLVGANAIVNNGGTLDMTASQFVDMVTGKYNKIAAGAGGSSTSGVVDGSTNAFNAQGAGGTSIMGDIGHLVVRGIVILSGAAMMITGLVWLMRGQGAQAIPVTITNMPQTPAASAPQTPKIEAPKVEAETPKIKVPDIGAGIKKGPSVVPQVKGDLKKHARSVAASKGHETRKKKPRIATVGGKKYVKPRKQSAESMRKESSKLQQRASKKDVEEGKKF